MQNTRVDVTTST